MLRGTRLAAAGILLLAARVAAGADWLQFDFGSRHTGVNPLETTIHANNVATLHQLWQVTLPSIADGAPAFLEHVTTPLGVRDLLFLTTKDGRILALDAANGSTVWAKRPATGPNYTTSSPAVDPTRQWVFSYGLEGKVHRYAVGDGTEVVTGGWPEIATLKPSVEKGSSALSMVTAANGHTYLCVTNGGYPGDAGDYQGHVTVVDLSTGSQNVFNANCSNQAVHFATPGPPDCVEVQTAIWARPGVVYDAEDDRIYMSTGNGTFDANTGGHDWGDTVFSLHPDGTGTGGGPLDSYTPTEYQQLQNADADLGSNAPALLPVMPASAHPRMAVQSGKDANLRLLNLADLSGSGAPGHTGGELQKIAVPQGGEVLTHLAVWTEPVSGAVWIFVANGSGISGLTVDVSGLGVPSLTSHWTKPNGGTSPILANGILYYATGGALRALDPLTGTQLWSGAIGGIHWESPIVVNGRAFVTDESGHLTAFGPNAAPLGFYAATPCRVFDTRDPAGPRGGPAIAAGATRIFTVSSVCGVPTAALSIAANVTVVTAGANGFLRVGPSGATIGTSNVAFPAGATRAGFAVLSLAGTPVGSVAVTNGSGAPVHVLLDIAGWFQ